MSQFFRNFPAISPQFSAIFPQFFRNFAQLVSTPPPPPDRNFPPPDLGRIPNCSQVPDTT